LAKWILGLEIEEQIKSSKDFKNTGSFFIILVLSLPPICNLKKLDDFKNPVSR